MIRQHRYQIIFGLIINKVALTEYYFRYIADDTLYCVFGREASTIFYPRINEFDSPDNYEVSRKSEPILQNSQSSSLSLDPKKNSSIRDISKPSIFKQESRLDILNHKRHSIVEPIKHPTIPLFRQPSNVKDNPNLRINHGNVDNANKMYIRNKLNSTIFLYFLFIIKS